MDAQNKILDDAIVLESRFIMAVIKRIFFFAFIAINFAHFQYALAANITSLRQLPGDAVFLACDVRGESKISPSAAPTIFTQNIIISRSLQKIWRHNGGNNFPDTNPLRFLSDKDFSLYESRPTPEANLTRIVIDHNLNSMRAQEISARSNTVIFEWTGRCKPLDTPPKAVIYPEIEAVNPRNIDPPLIGYVCRGHYRSNDGQTKFVTLNYLLMPGEKKVYTFSETFELERGIWTFDNNIVKGMGFTFFSRNNVMIKKETTLHLESGEFSIVLDDATSNPVFTNLKDQTIYGSCKRSSSFID